MSKRSKSDKKNRESILHRDIKDLEIARSLKRLANYRVTDWELKDLPNLKVTDWELKDIANYRVTEWELGDLLGKRSTPEPRKKKTPPAKVQQLADELGAFVRFVAENLIESTDPPVLQTQITSQNHILLKLTLEKRDAAALIGHGGHTAAAIRNLLNHIANAKQATLTLKIQERAHPHEV